MTLELRHPLAPNTYSQRNGLSNSKKYFPPDPLAGISVICIRHSLIVVKAGATFTDHNSLHAAFKSLFATRRLSAKENEENGFYLCLRLAQGCLTLLHGDIPKLDHCVSYYSKTKLSMKNNKHS